MYIYSIIHGRIYNLEGHSGSSVKDQKTENKPKKVICVKFSKTSREIIYFQKL